MNRRTMMTSTVSASRALAVKDDAALCALLADRIDFQALTPGRHWQAATPRQVVEEIILGHWFGAGDHIQQLCSVTSGQVAEREHVAYRLRVRRSGSTCRAIRDRPAPSVLQSRCSQRRSAAATQRNPREGWYQ